ncbi:MAG: Gfo/Idh/MocA family protein [Brevefilum sp.]|jgi:predicted dehydrogenase
MSDPIRILLFGAGNRGAATYGQFGLEHPDQVKFVAVAEPNPQRRERFAREHHIPPERQFNDWSEALAAGKIADAVINATQDEMHHESTIAALQAGYDMLLEKPISTTLNETVEIIQTAEALGRTLMICHVLRYTDFFGQVKNIFASGRLGQIANVSHSENVSYYHMAHSYVRGNWRNLAVSSPMILAKCCHDLDLLYWFLGEKCTHLSSMGNLRHFKPENAPPGAPLRCTDGCPAAEECPYFAPRIYVESFPIKSTVSHAQNPLIRAVGQLTLRHPKLALSLGKVIPPVRILAEYSGWPRNTITEEPESDHAVMEALRHGPYGRCVYHSDNDVVDHQTVNMTFESGITVTLTMHGHSHDEGRTLRVDGSRATLLGKLTHSQGWLEIHDHLDGSVERQTFPTEVEQVGGHGGGDAGLMRSFVLAMHGERAPLTSARDSLESHLMAFAAEESRLSHMTVEMETFRKKTSG